METLITVLIEAVPTLIISGLILYIFHEYLRFVNDRDKRLELLNSKSNSKSDSPSVSAPTHDFAIKLRLQAAERFCALLGANRTRTTRDAFTSKRYVGKDASK